MKSLFLSLLPLPTSPLSPSCCVTHTHRGAYNYELTLRTDMYTSKHTQWFYFRVRGMKAGVTYRFTIVNLMKGHSLYSHGMRPLLYSQRAAEEKGMGWHRIGSNIKYYRHYPQVGGSFGVTSHLTLICLFALFLLCMLHILLPLFTHADTF